MKKIVPVILLTSLFWVLVYLLVTHTRKTESNDGPMDTADYSEAIIGNWEPVELANAELTFSKYGTMRIGDAPIDINYSVNANKVEVSLLGLLDTSFEITVYNEDGDTYMEIFDAPQFAGKYKKFYPETASTAQYAEEPTTATERTVPAERPRREARRQQPRNVNHEQKGTAVAVEETEATIAIEECEPPKPETAVEQPAATVQSPKVEEQAPAQIDTPTDRLSITGVWSPVEGAEYPLTITKYGTVIQHINSVEMRYDYSLSGQNLNIGYDNNAKAEIYKANGDTFLEIYNSRKFSGKYRLKSRAIEIYAEKIDVAEIPNVLPGKWKPVFGAEHLLEMSKYGTAIQHIGSVDMRYDYSLNGWKLKIGYDDNAKIVISQNSSGTYLEIYNSRKFSGLYKKQ